MGNSSISSRNRLSYLIEKLVYQINNLTRFTYYRIIILSLFDIMIVDFGCKHTKKVWFGEKTTKWSHDIIKTSLRKLFMLNAIEDIKDLMIPPSNKLHKLKGDYKEYWAISVNNQWRIIFRWKNRNAHDVQIIDYH